MFIVLLKFNLYHKLQNMQLYKLQSLFCNVNYGEYLYLFILENIIETLKLS